MLWSVLQVAEEALAAAGPSSSGANRTADGVNAEKGKLTAEVQEVRICVLLPGCPAGCPASVCAGLGLWGLSAAPACVCRHVSSAHQS